MKKLLIAGAVDTRTRNLLAALAKGGILPARVVCVSTSGVYGDCGGARVDAEGQLALWCSALGCRRRCTEACSPPHHSAAASSSERLPNEREVAQ